MSSERKAGEQLSMATALTVRLAVCDLGRPRCQESEQRQRWQAADIHTIAPNAMADWRNGIASDYDHLVDIV